MMTKTEAIDEIVRRNPTVNSTFLEDFSMNDLRAYLERLCTAPGAPWELESDQEMAAPSVAI